ncbi:hypothetical protein [Paraburkholderia kirstenboschensis]|nr:hypothetical protein [Paraburkholderia kirstenboschensis]
MGHLIQRNRAARRAQLTELALDRRTPRAFMAPRPVSEWFYRAEPRVKSREAVPETIDADVTLALLLAEPLLIRRPLMSIRRALHSPLQCGHGARLHRARRARTGPGHAARRLRRSD